MRYFTFKLSTNQPFSKLSIDIGIGIILSTGDNLESVQFFSFQTNSTDENKLIMKSAQWALLIAHSKIPANAHMPRRLYCILRMLYLVALTDLFQKLTDTVTNTLEFTNILKISISSAVRQLASYHRRVFSFQYLQSELFELCCRNATINHLFD